MQQAWWGRALTALAAAALLAAALAGGHRPRDPVEAYFADNPDRFFLWAPAGSNSQFAYSFTYDPLAVDEWLFASGGPDGLNLVAEHSASPASLRPRK